MTPFEEDQLNRGWDYAECDAPEDGEPDYGDLDTEDAFIAYERWIEADRGAYDEVPA